MADILDTIVEKLQKAGYHVKPDDVKPDDADMFGYQCTSVITIFLESGNGVKLDGLKIPGSPDDDDLERALFTRSKKSSRGRR